MFGVEGRGRYCFVIRELGIWGSGFLWGLCGFKFRVNGGGWLYCFSVGIIVWLFFFIMEGWTCFFFGGGGGGSLWIFIFMEIRGGEEV